jgi:Flp pilus assembly protein TadG
MKTSNKQHGHTLIETAIILVVLLLIVFGITEFARAWFNKNSLKNAARQGVRVAAVTLAATDTVCPVNASGNILCDSSRSFTSCPNSDTVFDAVCKSPGIAVQSNPQVSKCFRDATGGLAGTLDADDTVNVCVRMNFTRIVPSGIFPFVPSQFYADASMRYE